MLFAKEMNENFIPFEGSPAGTVFGIGVGGSLISGAISSAAAISTTGVGAIAGGAFAFIVGIGFGV